MLVLPVTTTSPTPPVHPAAGDFWVNTTTNRRYVWYVMDSGQGQWVQADVPMTEGTSAYYPGLVGPTTPSQQITNTTPKITLAPQPPGSPNQGDLWWSTITGQQSVWYFDGNSYQWVISNYGGKEGPPGPPGAIGNIVAGPGLIGGGTTPVVDLAVDDTIIAPLDSPVFTGTPTAPTPTTGDNSQAIVTTAFVHTAIAAIPPLDLSGYALLNSPVFMGDPRAPTPATTDNDTSLATTAFVRSAITTYSPPPNLSGYAPLASPAFTGVPTAPNAAQNTDTTQLATTHFVNVELGGQLQFYAPLASPTFTGVPAAPTPAPGTNTTQLATAAFVREEIGAIPPSSSIFVGDTPPASPGANALWWRSDTGQMFIWYNDGTSTQWVPVTAPSVVTQQQVGWRILSRQVVSSPVAQVDFTNIPSDINNLMFTVENAVPVTNDFPLYLRCFDGTGTIDAGNNYNSVLTMCHTVMAQGAAAQVAPVAGGSAIVFTYGTPGNNVSNTANVGISLDGHIMGIRNTAVRRMMTFTGFYQNGANSAYYSVNGSGQWLNTAGVISGIRFLFNTSNIASGSLELWGSP